MSDLISRQLVENTVRAYFVNLIEKGIHEIDTVDCNAELQKEIDDIPTAYDVDKVVEQLEHMDRTPLYEDENSEEIIDYLLEQSEVIEIVKGSGKDE